jgi:hypothetical protein
VPVFFPDGTGAYHAHCRYCKGKYRVAFSPPQEAIAGEAAFCERLENEHFTHEEQQELIRDFAEIEYMRADNANPREVTGKGRMLEEKIAFFRHRWRT